MLDRVTITGADDSINPRDLIALTEEFPFVEWGILASRNNTIVANGSRRYPSPQWLAELKALNLPSLSLHINGIWVRNLLLGAYSLPDGLLSGFKRVQLNFHAEKVPCHYESFATRLREHFTDKDIIFQIDGEKGNQHMEEVRWREVPNCYGLFDVSGGAGILPTVWPEPEYVNVYPGEDGDGVEQWDYHGYAGGLGPQNLAEQLPLILKASAGNQYTREGRIWIDMETHIRSNDDALFDLAKVRQCLEIAREYIHTLVEGQ